MKLLTLAMAAAVTLGVGASASAAPLAITGSTTVYLDPNTVSFLVGAGFGVDPVAPGTLDLTTLTATFPITGGDETDGNTKIFHSGGLRFSRGGTSVDLVNFVINLPLPNVLTANGDDEFALFNLTANPAVSPDNPGIALLTLGADGAAALNATFFPGQDGPFTEGIAIGSATPNIRDVPEPTSLLLLGTAISLAARRLRRSGQGSHA